MMKKNSFRQEKIGETVRQALGEVFQALWLPLDDTLGLPQGGVFQDLGLCITKVVMSRDLSCAHAFVVFPGDYAKKTVLSFLNKNVPKIRFDLVKKIQMRYAPKLRFSFDDGLDRQKMIDDLFSKIEESCLSDDSSQEE
jgi:ribosome-binding factor A